jgi:hypothetical protein
MLRDVTMPKRFLVSEVYASEYGASPLCHLKTLAHRI